MSVPVPRPRRWAMYAVACAAAACGACTEPSAPEPVPEVPVAARPQRHLRDASGRSVILRGFNVSNASKGSVDRQPDITEGEIEQLSTDFGFRFSRHLVFWSAVEPSPGAYDEAYLDTVEGWLDTYAAHDVKVMLDMHQDIFAHAPTWGNGAPAWAVELALDGTVPTLPPVTAWSNAYYLAPVTLAFDRFFAYDPPYRALQDRYAAMWQHVAARFAGHPALVGYDLMNEPFPGSAWDPLEVGVSRFEESPTFAFDRELLGPFYQRVIDAIRVADQDATIFYEPRFGAPANGSRSYLPALVDPRVGEPRLGYAPHMYSVPFEANLVYEPHRDPSVERYEAARDYEIRDHDVPLVIGEWGLDQSHTGGLLLTEKEADAFDRMNASWAYWSFDPGTLGTPGWIPFYRTGDVDVPLAEYPSAEIVVRVYPLATAGDLVSFTWNRWTRVFTLVFRSVEGVTGVVPTEIFVPDERFYPDGFAVGFGIADRTYASFEFDDARNVLRVDVPPVEEDVVITITPRDVGDFQWP